MRPIYLAGKGNFNEVISLNLITTHLFPATYDLSPFSAIIITSKTVVQWLSHYYDTLTSHKLFVLGKESAKALQKEGLTPFYIASESYAEQLACDIVTLFPHENFLYLSCTHPSFNIHSYLHNHHISCEHYIVYETQCQKSVHLIENLAIIIFTSPSSVTCFEKNYGWDPSITAIAIGHKTASVIPSHISCHISSHQSIQACIELAQHYQKENL